MSRAVRQICVSSSPADVSALMAALSAALDGSGPAVLPVAATQPSDAPPPEAPDDVAVVIRTSGSTGAPRGVQLTAAALRASGEATAARLGGHGRWLLALPTEHVAGLQVLVRSLLAGSEPVIMPAGGFHAESFASAVAELDAGGPGRRYTSLVPTQLHRLLDSPVGVEALRVFDAVLLGGAAASPAMVDEARAAGVRVVLTYGMSETCGGCVYDGVPLDGVRVDVDPDGRVLLAGPVLAAGYLGRPDLDAEAFTDREDVRWLRTSDLGELVAGDGPIPRLRVLGRLDDVIVTGGEKVAPAAVERALQALDGVAEACVVGAPDAEWGQAVTAVVVPRPGSDGPTLGEARAAVAAAVGPTAAPRLLLVVEALPVRGPGKVDRRAVAEAVAAALDEAGHDADDDLDHDLGGDSPAGRGHGGEQAPGEAR
ncbi:o-succinylbenzoate--CoA ligase [Cellulomonas chengniuliangii]|uniref:o-succinylbenzoate--CoA ligase n=1 Tax=Cellulomonas chengniuliangii TaxID=2968084 RepID=UPI001D0E4B30|nr:o-succinylbenzoate--CoA ligase [Cellulomonas chengniuliangii]MCC2316815.1 o-succinylbenzoate--CoA ligase [Cellulomonas chengniuliangii]